MTPSPSKEFWDQRLLRWEERRYSPNRNWFESSSVNYRLHRAKEILLKHAQGKRVWELGCGSGLLGESLMKAGAQSYYGIDISSVAIDNAKKKFPELHFACEDILNVRPKDCDLVFSLGLFDWLSIQNVDTLMHNFEGIPFLHGFSEYRPLSLTQSIHRLYSRWNYQHNYRPRYHKTARLPGAVHRDPRLRFGIFLASFEL